MRFARLGLVAGFLPTLLCAQAPSTLDTLTVVGSRNPVESNRLAAAIQIITREDIQRSGATNLADLLRGTAGIEVIDAYGDGSSVIISMRGFGESGASNTLILLDDQPLNNSDIGAASVGRVAPSRIERIEILPGGTTLWGNQAVGGVIRIVTRKDAHTSAKLRYGSFSDRGIGLRAGAGDENWSIYADGLHERRDNYRDHNRLQRDQAGAGMRWNGETGQAYLQARWLDETLLTPGALFPAEIDDDRRQSAADFARDFSALKSWTATSGLGFAVNDSWEWAVDAGLRRDDGKFRLSFRGFPTEPSTQNRDVVNFNPRLIWRVPGPLVSQLALGLDYQQSEYRLRTQIGPQDNDQEVRDLWMSLRTELTSAVSLSLSGRQSHLTDKLADGGASTGGKTETRTYDRTTGGARLLWQPTPALAVHIAADEILRYPKVDEYFGFDENFAPTVLALKPQTGINTEAGLRWQEGPLRFSALAWRLQLRNEIAYDPSTFQNTNLNRTKRHGVSLQADAPIGPLWSAHAEWHQQTAKLENGRQIPLVARTSGLLSLVHTPAPQASVQVDLRAVGPRQPGGDYDASQEALPGYALLGVAWRNRLSSGASLTVRGDNLLGKKYAESAYEDFSGATVFYPMPKQHWRLELGWEW